MFYENTQGESAYHTFKELEEIGGFVHAFSTRRDDPSVKPEPLGQLGQDKIRLIQALGVKPGSLVLLRQVHSDRVIQAEEVMGSGPGPAVIGPADAVVTSCSGQFAVVRTADCVPVLIILPKEKRVCCIHAGWRGTRDRIVVQAARFFFQTTGAHPSRAIAAIGPCIRSCCYQVGPEVYQEYQASGHDVTKLFSDGRLDLAQSIRFQLKKAGIERVLDCDGCTCCRTDLWFSYRREGKTGRNWAIAGFRNPVT